jgi:hypothetical protein
MHFGKLTVSGLIDELEDCDPEAEVRLATQPSWPFEWSLSNREPGPVLQVDLEGQPIVYLVEGEQFGHLPGSVAEELGWSR